MASLSICIYYIYIYIYLADIVNKCNNTYHSTIKMKPIDGKSSTCTDSGIENKAKDRTILHLRFVTM